MTKNYLIRLVTVLILLKLVSSTESDLAQIHKLFSPKDRMRIFSTDDESKVPNYDVIHINWSKQQKRSTHGIVPLSLSVFNEDIDLNLKRLSPLVGPNTPVYYFRTVSTDFSYTVEYPFDDFYVDIYEDENRLASLTMNMEPNGEKYIESGVIGAHNLTIHRIPSSYLSQKKSYKASEHGYYIAQNMNDLEGVFSDPIIDNRIFPSSYLYDPKPDVIYPEILVLVDYSLTDKFMNSDELLVYVLTYWSRVDLLYRNLKNPKYKLSIAGVVIAEDMTAFEFINENSGYTGINNDKLDFHGVLNSVETWLFDHQDIIAIDSYDVAFVQTSRMSSKITVENGVTTNELGIAEMNSACYVNYADGVIKKAGIIFDDGSHSGFLTAAHELGHTLGADHDGKKCGGNDAGFIMSEFDNSPTSNYYKWSQCTLNDFESFLMTNPLCLYNVPDQYKDDLAPYSFDVENTNVYNGNYRNRLKSRKNYKTSSNRAVYPRIMA